MSLFPFFLLKMTEDVSECTERSMSPVGHDPSDEPPGEVIKRISASLESPEFAFFMFFFPPFPHRSETLMSWVSF